MFPALLLSLLPAASASDLRVSVRAPEGDQAAMSMSVIVGGPPPLMLPIALVPSPDGRRRKGIYTAEAALEPMGSSLGVTVRVYRGSAKDRELVLDSSVVVAPQSSASFRLANPNGQAGEWALDVQLAEDLSEGGMSGGGTLSLPPPPAR
jgi:hypothetical protein